MKDSTFDIVFLGHYTKDTIITPSQTRIADGGAFFYGASVTTRMGLRTAAITRLAAQDFGIVEELKSLGVEVVAIPSKNSTCLCLEYPEENPDLRTISVVSRADPFRPEDVISTDSRCFLVGPSIRGEVPREVLEVLSKKDSTVGLDVQRFYPKKVAGRSGRGDTCVAAYMARRLIAPPREAAVWAAAVTSLKLESEGPFRRSLGDVEALIGSYY